MTEAGREKLRMATSELIAAGALYIQAATFEILSDEHIARIKMAKDSIDKYYNLTMEATSE